MYYELNMFQSLNREIWMLLR